MSEWISVKDRLPEEKTFRSIYITAIYSKLKESTFVQPMHYIDGSWFDMPFEDDLDTTEYEVTHWMPLPNPPKEDTNES